MNYAVRITFPYARLASWCSRVSLVSEKCVFYEHAGDPKNVHIHGLIMGTSKDKTTLKNWVKEALGVAPARTQWVFSTHYDKIIPVDEGYIKYMTKGKYDPMYNKGFSEEVIAEAKAKGYDSKRNNDEKPDKNEEYLRGFRGYVEDLIMDNVVWENANTGHEYKFAQLRKWSYCYMMSKVKLPMPHDLARMKACVMRLAWELEIPLPRDDKVYKY